MCPTESTNSTKNTYENPSSKCNSTSTKDTPSDSKKRTTTTTTTTPSTTSSTDDMDADDLCSLGSIGEGLSEDTGRNTSDTTDSRATQAEKEKLAQKETTAVFRLRVLVILVLFLAAFAVSFIVLIITTDSEEEEFKTQFRGAGAQVLEAFENVVSQKVGAISSLAVATIAHGVDHKRDWPFVTLSSFQQRSSTARSLSDSLFVAFAPFVSEENRHEWEDFVTEEDSYWIQQGYLYQEEFGLDEFMPAETQITPDVAYGTNMSLFGQNPIYYKNENERKTLDDGQGPYLPVWQTSPVPKRSWVNRNLLRDSYIAADAVHCLDSGSVVFGGWDIAPAGDTSHVNESTAFYSSILSIAAKEETSYKGDPMSMIYLPIFDSFEEKTRAPVAVMMAVVNWAGFFRGILPQTVDGVTVVLESSCNGFYTYRIDGEDVIPIGPGDIHEEEYERMRQWTTFDNLDKISDGTRHGLPLDQTGCKYSISVYASRQFANNYTTNNPIVITSAVALIFIFTAFMFLVYDRLVERRQRLVLTKAAQTSAIVSSLFPENVRDRLMQQGHCSNSERGENATFLAPNHRLKSYLKGGDTAQDLGMAPIADLFPHSTVLFADIAGFTAWSSTREPAQVFILLQSVYQGFDILAKKLKVFKVETIGDSYVAVTGLPEPQANHAAIMARFAGECLRKMNDITKDLEVTLGPDTGDLSMRFGMHSGPVTAGVLRGDRARFQLFGDTVNTAARMESTGVRNKIQVSQSTADLLTKDGKSHWLRPREDAVLAKGKGVLNTFWLVPNSRRKLSLGSNASSGAGSKSSVTASVASQNIERELKLKHECHIDWIAELFNDCIKKIVATQRKPSFRKISTVPTMQVHEGDKTALDEVAEVINLPRFDAKVAAKAKDYEFIEIDPIVVPQIREYISTIASKYRNNPFHNFEHACHVTMSVNKFLKRIVTPDLDESMMDENRKAREQLASHLHDYTHGINSDPLTIFGIIFSAMIHDVDHRGVSNEQLIKEDEKMAKQYKNQSVAEQNSLDIAWDLLMSDNFKELRACLFASSADLMRFRQVIVNVVLATDIFDKELNDLRRNRWDKAFSGESANLDHNDLRATIVIEHLIQASDVAHTMQHWHVYCKWNRRLFHEMYAAYKKGRMSNDPSEFWYEGEIGFFDNYIIPLARKLKKCNVFGVSSDECLNYALRNRAEWAERGREIVSELKREVAPADHGSCPGTPLLGKSTETGQSQSSMTEEDPISITPASTEDTSQTGI